MFKRFNIHLRREPSQETHSKGRWDVVAYRDVKLSSRAGRWPWWASSKPTRRNKRVTLNCWPYQIVWHTDA